VLATSVVLPAVAFAADTAAAPAAPATTTTTTTTATVPVATPKDAAKDAAAAPAAGMPATAPVTTTTTTTTTPAAPLVVMDSMGKKAWLKQDPKSLAYWISTDGGKTWALASGSYTMTDASGKSMTLKLKEGKNTAM